MKSFSEASALLKAATDAALVEAALEDVTTHSIETEEAKNELLEVLQEVQQREGLSINAKLRRKVKRLQEMLLLPPQVKEPEPEKVSTTSVNALPSSSSETLKSFDQAILLLNEAKDNNEVEKALEGVTLSSEGSVISRNKLISSLEDIQENTSIVLNAKVRRKLKRLQEMLSSVNEEEFMKKKSLSVTTTSSTPASTTSTKVISKPLLQATQELLEAKDVSVIEKLLEGVTTSSVGSIIERNQFLHALNDVEENKELNLNAKLRRRMKRLNELLLSDVFKPTDGNDSIVNSVAFPFDLSDKSLTGLIDTIKETKDESLLEDYISSIRPGIGNCTSRRKLKRSLETILSSNSNENDEKSNDEKLNERLKRRCLRAINYLSSGSSDEIIKEREKKEKEEEEKKKLLNDLKENKNKHGNIIPYVVFVGQLDYSATKEEISDYFKKKGELTEEIIVRPKTNSNTKKFEGTAFIQCSNSADMFKCISLHHTLFKGRLINVERSCGGRNGVKRLEKIQSFRTEQQIKLSEASTRILNEYEFKKVLSLNELGLQFKEKLINTDPFILSKSLAQYETVLPNERNLPLLDSLVDKYSGKTKEVN